jgi:phage terminase large subunit-like protein
MSWLSWSPLASKRLEPIRSRRAAESKVDTKPDQSVIDEYNWAKNAREKQRLPAGDWRFWLILSGRYWGKTRTAAETVRQWAETKPKSLGALVGQTPEEVRFTMVEGESGILARSPPWFRPVWEPSKGAGKAGILTWPNGTTAQGFSATNYDKLRGPQFHWAWGDELAKWKAATKAFDQLNLSLRLPGFGPAQAIFTTTPRPIPIIRELLKRERVFITRGTTYENKENADPGYMAELLTQYERTRLGRQEINAEVLEDLAGAMWSHDQLDKLRLDEFDLQRLSRIVVGVDPSGGGDEQGIIVAGRYLDEATGLESALVLEDRSCCLSPGGWGGRSVEAFADYMADCIAAEVNFGGDMVAHTIETAAKERKLVVKVKVLHASRGKHVRAEPISALYEKGRVHHLGIQPELEDELTQFTHAGYQGASSPNRADAAVWALTELLVVASEPPTGVESMGSWSGRRAGAPSVRRR